MKKSLSVLFALLNILLIGLIIVEYLWLYCAMYVLLPVVVLDLIWIVVFLIKHRENKKNYFSLICIPFLIFIFIINCISTFKQNNNFKETEYVVHAGGTDDTSIKYLNCIESFENMLQKGYTLFELDFALTSDDEIVCTHTWEHFKGFSFDNPPTLEEFENYLIEGKYHGITFNYILQVLNENDDIKLIFDTKQKDVVSLIQLMEEKANEAGVNIYDKIIIQFYDENQLEFLITSSFTELWFTNYKVLYSMRKINELFENCEKVTTIVLYKSDYLLKFQFSNLSSKKIAVHTINEKSNVNFLKNKGVDYIFIDY